MDHKTAVGWAKNIKADCKRKGLTEQQTRDRIYSAALMVFSDDDNITPEAVEKAKSVVGAVMPGATNPALMVAITPPDSCM